MTEVPGGEVVAGESSPTSPWWAGRDPARRTSIPAFFAAISRTEGGMAAAGARAIGTPETDAGRLDAGRLDAGGLDVGALVIGAADGDRRAWDQLVVAHSSLVASITVAHRLDESDSARVRATVWRRLDRNLGKIRRPDQVGTWLAAVARDECVKALPTSGCHAA